jgi:hypothetical protein
MSLIKITRPEPKLVKVREIYVGDIFTYDDTLYIRIVNAVNAQFNAFATSLETGNRLSISLDKKVEYHPTLYISFEDDDDNNFN